MLRVTLLIDMLSVGFLSLFLVLLCWSVVMTSIIMLSVIILSSIMPNIVMYVSGLCVVVMLSFNMLSYYAACQYMTVNMFLSFC